MSADVTGVAESSLAMESSSSSWSSTGGISGEGGAESCGGMARAAAADSERVVGAFFGGMRFQGLGEVVGVENEP